MLATLKRTVYLWAQWKQASAKRAKDPSFRTLKYIDWVKVRVNPALTERTLAIGPRNTIELDLLAQAGFADVWGLDLLKNKDPRFLTGDMHRMPFHSRSFDLVWASHVLEHALYPAKAFDEIYRVLRSGGFFFAAWPTGFKTNWHDRHDYGNPRSAEVQRLMPGLSLVRSQYRQSADSTSAEWLMLARKP